MLIYVNRLTGRNAPCYRDVMTDVRGFHSAGLALAIFLFGSLFPKTSSAANICYELTEGFFRPPVIGLVRECVENWSEHPVRCGIQPYCCAPGCGAFPDCGFVERVILDDGKHECSLDGQALIEFWLLGGLFLQADPLEPLVALGRIGSRSFPQAWQNFFLELGNSSLLEGFRTLNASELAQVRLNHFDASGPLGWAADGRHRRAVVFNDLITMREGYYDYIFNNNPPSLDDVKCSWAHIHEHAQEIIALLLHELTHVKQYFDLGATQFYSAYLPDSGRLEDQATHLEDTFVQRARQNHGKCAGEIPGLGDVLRQEQHALSARQWLHINDRATVITSNFDRCNDPLEVARTCWSSLSSGGYLGVGATSKTGNLFARGGVQLRSWALVDGDVRTASAVEFQQGAIVRGDIFEGTPVSLTDITDYAPNLPPAATGTIWVNFQAGHLEPGNYGEVIANGQSMVLRTGDYYMNFLQIEPTATVVFDTQLGPVRVFVRNGLMHKGRFSGPADSILIAYLGTQDVHVEGRLQGTLVAPRAFVNLQSRNISNNEVSHQGAVYARAIELHQGAVFAHVPYRYDW